MKLFIATVIALFSLNASAQDITNIPSMDFTAMNKAIEAAVVKSATAQIGKVTSVESMDKGYYVASNDKCDAVVKVKLNWLTLSWKATTVKTICK